MNPRQLLQEKRQFIKWFLETQQLKNPKLIDLLKLFLSDDSLLMRTRFVTDIRGFQNALLISTKGADAPAFICRIDGLYYHLVEEAIMAIRNTTSETINVCLLYARCFPCSIPGLITDPAQPEKQDFIATVEQEMQQYFWQKEFKRQALMLAIDQALDERNKTEFFRLTKKLKNL